MSETTKVQTTDANSATGAGASSELTSTVAAVVEPFTAGIFVDNEPRHTQDVRNRCLTIITVDVPQTEFFIPLPLETASYVEMLQQLSDNGLVAAQVVERLSKLLSKGKQNYDMKSGIQIDEVGKITDWVEQKKKETPARLVAIFDFDRTISVMEGGFFIANGIEAIKERIKKEVTSSASMLKLLEGFTAEGYAEYLAGGKERMTMLQEMFDSLYENGVTIVVLTNNTACKYVKDLFKEIMAVFTRGRAVEVICGTEYRGDKGLAVVESKLCPRLTKGGRRGKKSRKQLRKRRQTKKLKTRS